MFYHMPGAQLLGVLDGEPGDRRRRQRYAITGESSPDRALSLTSRACPAYLGCVLKRLSNISLVLGLSVVLLAWGTSPCLLGAFCGATSTTTTTVADCCCCCGEETEAPLSGTEDCPICSSVGSMHELPPVGAKVLLDAPASAGFAVLAVLDQGSPRIDAHAHDGAPSLEPPRVHFTHTVALLR